MAASIPAEVLLGRGEVAPVIRVEQAEIGRHQWRRNWAHPQAEAVLCQVEKEGDHIDCPAGIPVAVEDQPVAQVLHLAGGDEAQKFRPHLEEAEIAGQAIFLPPAAELGQDRPDRLRHGGLVAAHGEAAKAGERHQLQGRLEHQPQGDRLQPGPQPLHLVVVEQQAGEAGIGSGQGQLHRLGAGGQVAIAEHLHRQLRTAPRGLGGRLAVEGGVEALETCYQHDALIYLLLDLPIDGLLDGLIDGLIHGLIDGLHGSFSPRYDSAAGTAKLRKSYPRLRRRSGVAFNLAQLNCLRLIVCGWLFALVFRGRLSVVDCPQAVVRRRMSTAGCPWSVVPSRLSVVDCPD